MSGLLESLHTRRTIRRFQQKMVEKEKIREILECVRMASCAANMQRLRYVVVQESSLVHALFDHTRWGAMVQPYRTPEWGKNAPLTFIAVTAPEKSPHLYADAGAAIQTMEYAAWTFGIGCCWIGSFDAAECETLLVLPQDRSLLYLVALGYPAETPVAEDAAGSVRYYLDESDRLHVPKRPVDEITLWR